MLFVGGVAALAEQDPANRVSHPPTTLAVDPASLTPSTTVVVERVARTIYLDRYGNVVAPPAGVDPAAAAAGALPAGSAPGARSSGGQGPGTDRPGLAPRRVAQPGACPQVRHAPGADGEPHHPDAGPPAHDAAHHQAPAPSPHGSAVHREHVPVTARWAHRAWTAMGSTADVVVFADGSDELADWAVAEIERLETSWSRFRPDSELNDLHRHAGSMTPISPTLWAAVTAAAEAWRETHGRFDPTILGALASLGYDRSFATMPADLGAPRSTATVAGFASVALDPDARAVGLPVGVGLDLGGIGKGLAADLVVDELEARGARSVAVSLGGDVRVAGEGPHADGTWLIPVMRPTDGARLGEFPVVDEALVQSTVCIRSWTAGASTCTISSTPAPAGRPTPAWPAWWSPGPTPPGARPSPRPPSSPGRSTVRPCWTRPGSTAGSSPVTGPSTAPPAWPRIFGPTSLETCGGDARRRIGALVIAALNLSWYVARSAGLVAWFACAASVGWGLTLVVAAGAQARRARLVPGQPPLPRPAVRHLRGGAPGRPVVRQVGAVRAG